MSNGFTLNLGFGGMCLMVPDFEDGKLVAMHVLFPHSGCCDYEHVHVALGPGVVRSRRTGDGAVAADKRAA